MSEIKFETIGAIRTAFKTLEDMPIQPMGASGEKQAWSWIPNLQMG